MPASENSMIYLQWTIYKNSWNETFFRLFFKSHLFNKSNLFKHSLPQNVNSFEKDHHCKFE